MILKEKVDFLMGTNGSNYMKIINQTAKKYKKITVNFISSSDDLMDAKNFSKYSFMTCASNSQIGRAAAYFYGQIRKKEKKFYVLCQDYSFGHSLAQGFIDGMKEYYPDGEIVGEDYHKLFLTDFAPYLTKIKASGAEVIYTGDWVPDAGHLLKQARQMGIDLPFIHLFLGNPSLLTQVGIENSKGLMAISPFSQPEEALKNEAYVKYLQSWEDQWKTWSAPYNSLTFKWPTGTVIGATTQVTYWFMDVIKRAGTTDPEKIIKLWENDSYEMVNGHSITMREKDHKAYQDLSIIEYVPPEEQSMKWFEGCSYDGPVYNIPAKKVMPWIDPALKR